MESILDRIEDKGIAIGEERGKKIGELKGKVSVYYKDMGLFSEEIAQKLNQPLDVIMQIIKELK